MEARRAEELLSVVGGGRSTGWGREGLLPTEGQRVPALQGGEGGNRGGDGRLRVLSALGTLSDVPMHL